MAKLDGNRHQSLVVDRERRAGRVWDDESDVLANLEVRKMVLVLLVCLRSTASVSRSSGKRKLWKREKNDRARQRCSHRCTSQVPNTFVGRIPPPPQLGRADPLSLSFTFRPLLDDYGPFSLAAARPKLDGNMLPPLLGSLVYARPSK